MFEFLNKKGSTATFSIILLVALLYVLAGYAGLFFAIPPGYATAIWAPSGVALGAVLVWGLRAAPGVFLGSFITNYIITAHGQVEFDVYIALALAFIIACGALLQVIIGWMLLKKWVGLRTPLIDPKDILNFALISGPISCLVNATWSNTILSLLTQTHINYFLSFGTWWIGDSMGVLIFTPVFLILFGQPRMLWRPRMFSILLPLIVSFIAVNLVYLVVFYAELGQLELSFAQQLSQQRMELQTQLDQQNNTVSNNQQLQKIMRIIFFGNNSFYSVKLIDLTLPHAAKEIYHYINPSVEPTVGVYHFTVSKQLIQQQKKLVMIATPSRTFINQNFSWQLWFVLVSGLLFCVLMNVILFILHGQKMLVQAGLDAHRIALKKEESKNLLILRAAGEGIFGIDMNGYITFANPAAARLLGYIENDLIGKSIQAIMHYKSTKGHPEHPIYATLKYNKVYHASEEKIWREDGSSLWAEYTSSPLVESGMIHGAVVVFNDITQRKAIDLELHRMAHFDVLTGIPNRASFFDHLSVAANHSEENHQGFAVCFIDLDNFKQINDSLGHTVGDEALKIIAQILQNELRKTDYLARLGGDEFAILFENIHTTKEITLLLEHIIEVIKKPIKIGATEVNMSMSIGVAMYSVAGTIPEELLKNADIAMYHAKATKKGTFAFFDETLNKKIQRRQQIDTRLHHALDKNEFILNYQLQVDVDTMQPFGVEALLRWYNFDLGEIEPEEFIPIAEMNGCIQPIGDWVLKQAFIDFQKICTFYHDDNLYLSVNVSILQLENVMFLQNVIKLLHETGMKSDKLVFEITESTLMHNPEHVINVMNKAKKIGILFSLDDFGVSYSSLHYLKDMPVSFIKIDKSFVSDISKNERVFEIVNATFKMAHSIGVGIIAEGVETEEQLYLLKALGCHYVQGFYFSKPMPIQKLFMYLTLKAH